MVAVQGENTADVGDYQLKTSTFYEMSTYTIQEGVFSLVKYGTQKFYGCPPNLYSIRRHSKA